MGVAVLWWFWWWLLFVLVFLMIPLGYGAGYRGWGWPSYRRTPTSPGERARIEEIEREEAAAEAAGWGVFALLFWMLFVVAVIWFLVALAAAA